MKTISIILILFLVGCNPFGDDPDDVFTPGATSVHYKVTGTASSVSITINNDTGGTEQATVDVPYSKIYSDYYDDFLYISAQNQGNSGSVTVSIYVNGNLVEQATSTGPYVIASASGSL